MVPAAMLRGIVMTVVASITCQGTAPTDAELRKNVGNRCRELVLVGIEE
jgi:hypothetical protein